MKSRSIAPVLVLGLLVALFAVDGFPATAEKSKILDVKEIHINDRVGLWEEHRLEIA
jgi:hypothetical protein